MEKMQVSINKDLQDIKNKQTETRQLLKLKILQKESIAESEAEEWISELEARMVEITSKEQNKRKRMKRTEDSLKDLWGSIKHNNIQIIGIPEEEEEEKKRCEKFFEEITVENFPYLGKEIVNQP